MVDAVVREGRSASEVARSHGLSRSWVHELVARFRAGGYAAIEPRSHRPRRCAREAAIEKSGAGGRSSLARMSSWMTGTAS